jgi:peptide/nickel transport system permease protein
MDTDQVIQSRRAGFKFRDMLATLTRVMKYTGVRTVTLFLTVVVGVFLTIIIANMGGYVDRIQLGEIQENVAQSINKNPAYRNLSSDERKKIIDEGIRIQSQALGLDKPFLTRAARFLWNAMTLELGRSLRMSSDSGSRQVRIIILERLPPTLVLFGASSFILFFVELFIALSLSRKYASFWDKVFVAMAPSSTAPAWFYGIFLILIFASFFKALPFGGMVDAPPPSNSFLYALSVLKHMLLPTIALALNSTFLNVYTWRTFFLIYSSEDYVEMAKAKGLQDREIERRYILRPTLPAIITTFALTMIYVWAGATILETVFNWPGLGRSLYQAIQFFDTPVIVGNTVIFAYLLAITVFLLEFIYVLVDPRVKIGQGTGQA